MTAFHKPAPCPQLLTRSRNWATRSLGVLIGHSLMGMADLVRSVGCSYSEESSGRVVRVRFPVSLVPQAHHLGDSAARPKL